MDHLETLLVWTTLLMIIHFLAGAHPAHGVAEDDDDDCLVIPRPPSPPNTRSRARKRQQSAPITQQELRTNRQPAAASTKIKKKKTTNWYNNEMRRHTDQHKKHRARASSTRRLQQRPLLESLLAEEEVEINKVETTKSVTPAAVIEIDEEEDPRPTALPTMEKEDAVEPAVMWPTDSVVEGKEDQQQKRSSPPFIWEDRRTFHTIVLEPPPAFGPQLSIRIDVADGTEQQIWALERQRQQQHAAVEPTMTRKPFNFLPPYWQPTSPPQRLLWPDEQLAIRDPNLAGFWSRFNGSWPRPILEEPIGIDRD